jgi:hypothetical protein
MDKHTFGKDRGSEILVEILNKSSKRQKKYMGSFLQKYILELEELRFVQNYQIKIGWLERIYQYYKRKLATDLILVPEIKDFGNNTLVSLYRNKLRQWELRGKNWHKRNKRQINKND